MRAQILRRLLAANTEQEKQTIKLITACLKFMHQNYDIEHARLNRVLHQIVREFNKGALANGQRPSKLTEPTHVPEDIFIKVAQSVLRQPQFESSRLYEKLRPCLLDPESV